MFLLSGYTSIQNFDVTLQFCHSCVRRFGGFVSLMTRCIGSTDSLLKDIMLPSCVTSIVWLFRINVASLVRVVANRRESMWMKKKPENNAIGNTRCHREVTKGSEFISIFTKKYRRIRLHLIGQRSYHNRNVKHEIANHKYLHSMYKTSHLWKTRLWKSNSVYRINYPACHTY